MVSGSKPYPDLPANNVVQPPELLMCAGSNRRTSGGRRGVLIPVGSSTSLTNSPYPARDGVVTYIDDTLAV